MNRKDFNQCVLFVLTYGTEMWILTKNFAQKVAQQVMERQTLGLTLRDHVTNIELHSRTILIDLVDKTENVK